LNTEYFSYATAVEALDVRLQTWAAPQYRSLYARSY